jgi:hypothetical protein
MADSNRTETVSEGPSSSGTIRIFAPGTEVGSRYAIRGVLGTGGYAVVYRAFDRVLKRDVALKVLRPDRMTEASLKRLRREVTVARDAESPRLVRIYDGDRRAERSLRVRDGAVPDADGGAAVREGWRGSSRGSRTPRRRTR